MREITLDTETTGLDPRKGDRIVEIGCIEMVDGMKTGETFHVYINPERDMPDGAFKVHGLSTEFLQDKPVFSDIAEAFLAFLSDSQLVIHNASFDLKFINAEFDRLGIPSIPKKRAVDTLEVARKKFPGSPVNLDALCKRFGIDLSSRVKHGALLDAELLALVYIELVGGKQKSMVLDAHSVLEQSKEHPEQNAAASKKEVRKARIFALSDTEKQAHQAFVQQLKNPIWQA